MDCYLEKKKKGKPAELLRRSQKIVEDYIQYTVTPQDYARGLEIGGGTKMRVFVRGEEIKPSRARK